MLISRSEKDFWEWGVGFVSAERGWDVRERALRRRTAAGGICETQDRRLSPGRAARLGRRSGVRAWPARAAQPALDGAAVGRDGGGAGEVPGSGARLQAVRGGRPGPRRAPVRPELTYAQVSTVLTQLTQVCWMLQIRLLSSGQQAPPPVAAPATPARRLDSRGASVSLARLSFLRSFFFLFIGSDLHGSVGRASPHTEIGMGA